MPILRQMARKHLKMSLQVRVCLIAIFTAGLLTGSVQFATAQNAPRATLTVQRIYSSPSLSGSQMTGIEWSPDSKQVSYLERNPPGQPGSNELWTMDAATGARKVLVKSETLAAVMQPEKTKAIQSTGLGRIEPDNYTGLLTAIRFCSSAAPISSARPQDHDARTLVTGGSRSRRREILARRQVG